MKALCKLKKKDPKAYKEVIKKFSISPKYFCKKCERKSSKKELLCEAKKIKN